MAHGQYFDTDPKVGSRPAQVDLVLPDIHATLRTDRGVFAAGGIDPGTVALLRESPVPPAGGNLLDLGCGYGPIACVLARRSPGATVWAVDVNRRALELTATNASEWGCGNVRAVPPDAVPAGVGFAGIWSNPPIRIGKPALHELLSAWLPRLDPSGQAWLVVHKHLGGDSLASWLQGCGHQVERRASKRGYRILTVTRAV